MKHTFAFTFGGIMMLAFFALFIFSAPSRAHANEASRLGGGNALLRVSGISHANTASGVLSRLTFASTRGGMPDEVPPPPQEGGGEAASNTGGNVGDGGEGSQGDPAPESVNTNGAGEGGNNGGASTGNGGNGGNASPGGLVRAGNVVSNATALNAINVNILRISINSR